MFKVLAELLMAREVEFEQGQITVLKNRFMLIPVDLLAAITKDMSTDEQKTKWLYKTTKQVFREKFVRVVREKYSMDKKKLFNWIASVAELAGYGRVEIVDYDEKNMRGIARVHNCAMCAPLKPAPKATGHIIRGMAAGIAEAAYNAEGDCIETKCIAKGDEYCEFVVRLRSDFEKDKAEIIAEQLSLQESSNIIHNP